MTMTASVEEALRLLDEVLPPRTVAEQELEEFRRAESRLKSLGMFLPVMGPGVQTKGCKKCGGTMYKTYETDANGNRTSQFVCSGCGAVL